ncbi:hypothetical protein N7481_008576 [Penicillium waksmanii]|uniref:uncharacterized protein n=1 Tax=Penicillium waksmanii TaxID=69791 RepID=UPI00254664BD|nr:uncharacterized protein N7481_008576 [Penicillium waksmanii]KAJ5974869.1 hypothetical protein N7481_008576 [Penicillium waksmanii]
MLIFAIPLLMQVRVPLKQKLILLILFGMGTCRHLNKVYCLFPSLISYVYMNWYFREATVAILVTNVPWIWPLMWALLHATKPRLEGLKHGLHKYGNGQSTTKGSGSRPYAGHFEMQNFTHSATVTPFANIYTNCNIGVDTNSEQRTISRGDDRAWGLEIKQDNTVTV